MTDVTGSDTVGDDRFYIFDRSTAKFVSTDKASEEQLRLYGQSVYTSAGSGRARVMTVFDPRGEPTSYSVSQTSRQGQLVPAGRAAGREGLAAQRKRERDRVRQSVDYQRNELIATERRRKIESLQVDLLNEANWENMTTYTKELLASDFSLLDDESVGFAEFGRSEFKSKVMDYVFFGTPSSPGLFMDGVSDEYVYIPELDRFKNATFASEEERLNSQIYTADEVTRQLGEFDPIADEFGLPVVRSGIRAVSRVVGAIKTAYDSMFYPLEFRDIEGFPRNAFSELIKVDANNKTTVINVANPEILIPWITNNYELLTPSQQRKMDQLVGDARENFESTVPPSGPRRYRPMPSNPWEAIETPEARAERIALGQRQEAQDAVPPRRQELERERQAAGVEIRNVARTRAREIEQALLMNTLAANIQDSVTRDQQSYEFFSTPLGFQSTELVESRRTYQDTDRYKEIRDELTSSPVSLERKQELDQELFELQQETPDETFLQFRPGFGAYTTNDQILLTQARLLTEGSSSTNLLSRSQREEMSRRGAEMQSSARRDLSRSQEQPLDAGEANLLLRRISANPVKMAQLKQRLLAVGGSDENYVDDTSMDTQTISLWQQTVAMANNAGQDPEKWLADLQSNPAAKQRMNNRNNSGPAAFTVRLPSQDDVAEVVQDVARRRLGQQLAPEQAKQLAAAYVSMAESSFRSQQGATTVTDPMDAQTFAQQQIGQQFGSDEMVYQTGLQLDTLIEMIGG